MHWAERIARQIIDSKPDKKEYVCAAGISPSGSIHIGNFRDIATSLFVVKSLEKLGKKVKFIFSWDELDRLRKVPKNVQDVTKGFEVNIGKSYVDIENPFKTDAPSYARYFEDEFIDSIKVFNINLDFRHQAEMYRSGKYVSYILTALQKRKQIFDILDRHRTQDAAEGERDAYYPVSIYCPHCGRDTTTINSLSDDCKKAEYSCKCGHNGTFDFTKDFNCKLAWKVDWPMRWAYEQVDFEPGGKDHASTNGSYDTSKEIAAEIFGYKPPIFQGYEFIGIKGLAGKMSGSSGLNLTPKTLLNLYQPELLLWLYARCEPDRAFDFCFDDGILKQYFEYDKMYDDVKAGKANPLAEDIIALSSIAGRQIKTVPMSLIVQLGAIVDFNPQMMEVIFAKIGEPYKVNDFADRIELAKYWLESCSPESVTRLRIFRNWDFYETLSDTEKAEIEQVYKFLCDGNYDLDSLRTELYAIPKRVRNTEEITPEVKKAQSVFFANVYNLLIGKPQGPRLYLFLYAIDKNRYLPLLDFSTPRRADEVEVKQEVEPQAPPTEVKKPKADCLPDIIEPIAPSIELDDFLKCDIRVATVLKCAEIRKSHSCYKITVSDGLRKNRVIVSSIKQDYTPEELIGKKILIIANLSPKRLAGVTSEGMLLATTDNANGCKVTFVDDSVPDGIRLK